jgi:hypothetical protein
MMMNVVDPSMRQCKICCRQGTCERGTTLCTALIPFGKVLMKREYQWFAKLEIPLVSTIPVQDFTMEGFPKSAEFHHIIIDALYKDGNGVKYCAITGLSRTLQPFTAAKLYTFTALHTFMESIQNSTLRHVICRKDFAVSVSDAYPCATSIHEAPMTNKTIPTITLKLPNPKSLKNIL